MVVTTALGVLQTPHSSVDLGETFAFREIEVQGVPLAVDAEAERRVAAALEIVTAPEATSAIPYLIDMLGQDRVSGVAGELVAAFTRAAPTQVDGLRAENMARLSEADLACLVVSQEALGKIGVPAVPALIAALRSPAANGRGGAAKALGGDDAGECGAEQGQRGAGGRNGFGARTERVVTTLQGNEAKGIRLPEWTRIRRIPRDTQEVELTREHQEVGRVRSQRNGTPEHVQPRTRCSKAVPVASMDPPLFGRPSHTDSHVVVESEECRKRLKEDACSGDVAVRLLRGLSHGCLAVGAPGGIKATRGGPALADHGDACAPLSARSALVAGILALRTVSGGGPPCRAHLRRDGTGADAMQSREHGLAFEAANLATGPD
jgi:hypothetical protein